MAVMAMHQAAHAAVQNYRTHNPFITSVFSDWVATLNLVPNIARCFAPGPAPSLATPSAGASSFGMSGVNAHAVLTVMGAAALRPLDAG
jgi:acyl transferase domain-containing protein